MRTFTASSPDAIVVSLPDFTRGPGQPVDVPATENGLPLYVSNVNNSETKISLDDAVQNWAISSAELKKSMAELFDALT